MPRAEVGTPKYVANKMKSKGLQRLRWYCQVCEKQCRDENGFNHIAGFSQQFQSEFVALLSRRFGTKRVRANQVYQEYIADKNHLHMNATRWVTLSEFVKHLGRTGVARVDETEKGWFIAWIDSSPKALEKAEAAQKKDRATISDEARERQLIAEQIERAAAETNAEAGPSTPPAEMGLKRDENSEKVVLSLSMKPTATPAAPTAFKMNPTKAAVNPLKANPLKRPNVFKTATPTAASSESGDKAGNEKKRSAPMTAAERLIIEEQERKRRRMDRDNAS
ncbi:domain of Kin17 curved DNA-binding protein-domain-containing protein [Pholiota molesta]|nr:domain of Kin17 curved DNA-binding protein-domain-containing protein [Pholiota molesta]